MSARPQPRKRSPRRRRVPFRIRLMAWWQGYEVRYKEKAAAAGGEGGKTPPPLSAPPMDMSPPTEEEAVRTRAAGGALPEPPAASEAPATPEPPAMQASEEITEEAADSTGPAASGNDEVPALVALKSLREEEDIHDFDEMEDGEAILVEPGHMPDGVPSVVADAIRSRVTEIHDEARDKLSVLSGLEEEEAELVTDEPENAAEPFVAPRTPGENRADAAQTLWGTGYSAPESLDFLGPVLEPLNLGQEQHMLFLGAGTGGAVREIVRRYLMTVDAMDLRQEFADRGDEHSRDQMLDRSAPVQLLVPGVTHFRPRYYDCALVKEMLHLVESREKFLQEIAGALKPGSGMVFFTFALATRDEARAIEVMAGTEPGPVFFQTAANIRQDIEATGLIFQEDRDMTEDYLARIRGDLERFLGNVAGGAMEPGFRELLMKEVEMWNHRISALSSEAVTMRAMHFVSP